MGKLEGKVAVITGGSSGLALASAKRFVEEGAYVFITGRRQEALDEAVKLIGRNVTGVQGDAADLDDLDRPFDTVKKQKGKIDVLFASAGTRCRSNRTPGTKYLLRDQLKMLNCYMRARPRSFLGGFNHHSYFIELLPASAWWE
jgi:NAD(P)-dependent dehydrogenase (short-subunit alcohol dehydrogenase family)